MLNCSVQRGICISSLLQFVVNKSCHLYRLNFLFQFEERQARVMKILFLFFSLAMLGAINSRTEGQLPMVKVNKIRGRYIKYITVDSCGDF